MAKKRSKSNLKAAESSQAENNITDDTNQEKKTSPPNEAKAENKVPAAEEKLVAEKSSALDSTEVIVPLKGEDDVPKPEMKRTGSLSDMVKAGASAVVGAAGSAVGVAGSAAGAAVGVAGKAAGAAVNVAAQGASAAGSAASAAASYVISPRKNPNAANQDPPKEAVEKGDAPKEQAPKMGETTAAKAPTSPTKDTEKIKATSKPKEDRKTPPSSPKTEKTVSPTLKVEKEDPDFSPNPVQRAKSCKVTGWTEEKDSEGKGRTFYLLVVQNDFDCVWTLKKTYTNFYDLHQVIKVKYASLEAFDFPGKTVVMGGTKEKRRIVFEEYSNLLASRHANDKVVYDFFKPDEGSEFVNLHAPPLRGDRGGSEGSDPFAHFAMAKGHTTGFNHRAEVVEALEEAAGEEIWNAYKTSRGPWINTLLFVLALWFAHAGLLSSERVFTQLADYTDAITVLEAGAALAPGTKLAGASGGAFYVTPDCNLVLEGAHGTGDWEVHWEAHSGQRGCPHNDCGDCAVTLDGSTGQLVLKRGKKALWASRKPFKSSVQGNYTALVTDDEKLVIQKGGVTKVTVGHPAKTSS